MMRRSQLGSAMFMMAVFSILTLALPVETRGTAEVRFFTGGGFGTTEEMAVRIAISDAETSASAEQLYTCELVGEPSIFPTDTSPKGIRGFRAEATVDCTPPQIPLSKSLIAKGL